MSPNADAPPPPSGELQFQTAETLDTRRRCTVCRSVLEGQFYQVQGVDVCEKCAAARREFQELPDSKAKFMRAFLYGSGAAFASWVVWSIVVVTTGFQIGILAIGVGWIVGTAIRKGTEGHSSRKYQLMAVGLTYLAIAMSFIPLLFSEVVKKHPAGQKQQIESGKKDAGPPVAAAKPEGPRQSLAIALATVLGMAVIWPVAGPFLHFPGGLISLFIVYLGLQRAWQLTKPDDALITGPFELQAPE